MMPTLSRTDLAPAKKAAVFGILGALAIVLSIFDSLLTAALPFFPVGVKCGFSNLALTAAASFSPVGGFFILAIKVLFALIRGGFSAAAMSLSGGIPATAATTLLLYLIKRSPRLRENLSFIGISVLSASLHAAGQLGCACVLTGTPKLFSYGKYLLLFAAASGVLTGILLNLVIPRLQKIFSDL